MASSIEKMIASTFMEMAQGLESGQWTVDQPSDDMKAAMQEISEEIWEESREKYGDEIMDVIISGEYRTLSES